eukprot:1149413-Pelagomonas_calceolata.AAC.2
MQSVGMAKEELGSHLNQIACLSSQSLYNNSFKSQTPQICSPQCRFMVLSGQLGGYLKLEDGPICHC